MVIRLLCVFGILLWGCQQNQPTEHASNQEAPANQSNQTSESNGSIVGIDISQYQGDVNFQEVKAAGNTFVFIKATQGITLVDPKYAANMEGARAAGLVVGAYHFYMTDDDPTLQFGNFSKAVQLKAGDLPPVVDIEALSKNSRPNIDSDLQTFLDELEKQYGVKPILYSGEKFSNEYLTEFGDYPLWIAEYGPKEPDLPTGWSSWTFWQWSQAGTVDGVSGDVDMDRFHGDESQFKAFLIQ